ncbi:hypothetical protein B0H13DRAFT_1902173 [Mycena leptocephala]|nr:hypothetical protein B0H13DRAFT_1902173 [Mycena leptocephala]
MSDSPEPVVTHPVAPHLAGGKESEKTSRVGPDLAAYAERRVGIIYEADEPGEGCSITYAHLLRCATSRTSLPRRSHAAAALLACARIRAIHSVVFAGFSTESLRDRVLITSDEGRRGGTVIATKAIVDAALKDCPGVEYKVPSYCPPQIIAAEDAFHPLHLRLDRQAQGRRVHHGRILCAALSVKYVFDVHPSDRFACMADVGWITGHTYIIYGPLLNGVSTLMFENSPVCPSPARYWETVTKHKITQLYSAPTAVRLLRRSGLELGFGLDPPPLTAAWAVFRASRLCRCFEFRAGLGVPRLRVALPPSPPRRSEVGRRGGSSGEWGTTLRPMGYPFYTGYGAARDEGRYIWIKGWIDGGCSFVLAGDGGGGCEEDCEEYDDDGLTPSTDRPPCCSLSLILADIINVSGHRLSTTEIESALIMHKGVAETAGALPPPPGSFDAELTWGAASDRDGGGRREFTYNADNEAVLVKELVLQVRKVIGPFEAPKKIYIVPDVPKTRVPAFDLSPVIFRILRRIMRKIVVGEGDRLGDLSTVAEPGVADRRSQRAPTLCEQAEEAGAYFLAIWLEDARQWIARQRQRHIAGAFELVVAKQKDEKIKKRRDKSLRNWFQRSEVGSVVADGGKGVIEEFGDLLQVHGWLWSRHTSAG